MQKQSTKGTTELNPGHTDKKRKVCIFMADFAGGGAERVMVNLANGLALKGHIVEFVVARAEGPYMPLVHNTIPVHAFSGRLGGTVGFLSKYLSRHQPDALLVSGEHACAVAIVARRISSCRAKVVATVHSAIWPDDPTRSMKLTERLNPYFIKVFFPFADSIVAVCQKLRDECVRWIGGDPSRFHAIYNPIFSVDFGERAAAPVQHRWLGDHVDRAGYKVLSAVGRLDYQKGFDILIRALSLVRQVRDVRLVLMGIGPELSSLQALASSLGVEDFVDLIGFTSNPYAFVSRSDLFVMSSRSEGFGNVLVEALAVGTPVVSTDCGGPAEILENGQFGTLVPAGEPGGLAAAILGALDAPVDKARLVERAKYYSIDRAVDFYEIVLGLKSFLEPGPNGKL